MTPTQIMLVKNSFRTLAPERRRLGSIFFADLFAREPSMRALFAGDLGRHASALYEGLAAIVGELDRLHPIVPALEWLALRNARRGVADYHYEAVAQALLATISAGLGERFTGELREAWIAAHRKVMRLMLASVPDEAIAA